MDELEEFLGVFFQECDERLGELQDCLAAISDGTGDAETLNAAFRAVHSVKGGAGAFGLNDLVDFTHIFETVMDQLRSNTLEPTQPICQLLLRSSDMMATLIEAAQGRGDTPVDAKAKLMAELQAVADGVTAGEPDPLDAFDAPGGMTDAAEDAADAAENAVESDGAEGDGAAAAEPADAPEAPAEAVAEAPAEAAGDEDDADDVREVMLRFAPSTDFMRSGHDPLRFMRALGEHGSVTFQPIGAFAPLEEFNPLVCTLQWRVRLLTEMTTEQLDDFLFMYRLTADISVETEEEAAEEAGVAPAAVEGAPVAAEAAEQEPAAEAAPAPTEASAEAAAPAAESTPAPAEPTPSAPAPEAAAAPAQPKAPAQPQAQSQAQAQAKMSKALRVELSRIDRLVNMVGEIVITQAVLSNNISELGGSESLEIGHAVEALSRQTRELQESVMAIRAQPVKSVFSRMPRVVRDLCSSLNKECRIILEGEQTEVDTTVIEELSEPLTHMLRNSMDHGIEMPEKREAEGKERCGTIRLSAEHRGERVRIMIVDDGAGINREKVLQKAIENGIVSPEASLSDEEIDMLIFHPGFSTADKVTNVSGRGVGMDVVKKKVQALGGRVSVISTPGKGSEFAITLPLTLAVLEGMTVGVGQERFILPLGSVVEAVKIEDKMIDHLPGDVRVLKYRGDWLPLICLGNALNLDTAIGREELVVIVETEADGRVALLVDELLGQRQVVLKSLEANFKRVEGVSGATILGDGRVALILDVPALQQMSGGGGFGMQMESF